MISAVTVRLTKYPHGQGLLEATLAIGMILIGLGAVLTLTIQNVSATASSSQRLVAAQLAREGIEAVRDLRDSNWLAANNKKPAQLWDDGRCHGALTACKDETDCVADGGVACRPLHDDPDCGTLCNGAIIELSPAGVNSAVTNVTMLSDIYSGSQSRDIEDSDMPALEMYRSGPNLNPGENYLWIQRGSVAEVPNGYNATSYRRLVLIDPVCRHNTNGTINTEASTPDCQDDTNWTKIGLRVESVVSWPAAGIFGGTGRKQISLVEYMYNWR